MKLRTRIAAALCMMFAVSTFHILSGICMITSMAESEMDTETDAYESTVLEAPEKAWWSGPAQARWKGVKQSKQYQVKLYEDGGLQSAVVTVKVSAVTYDFSDVMVDGKEYYFMVRSVPKVNEQQMKSGSDWTVSEVGEPVTRGETGGTWRHYLEGSRYEMADGSHVTAGWKMIHGSWYYFSEPGYAVKNSWLDWEGLRYYLTEDGSAKTGWMELSGSWYWFSQSGEMMTGWHDGNQPSERYYLNPDGTMARDTTVDGITIDSSGLAVKG